MPVYKHTQKKLFRQSEDEGFKTRAIAQKAEPFFLICPKCAAIKENKRWYFDPEVTEAARREHEERLCPGCEAVANTWYEGMIILRNPAISHMPGQVEALIHNQEDAHRVDDPKNRIVRIDKGQNEWRVYTATPFLARMIAERLESAYGAHAQYRWSRDERLVKILWE